MKLFRMLNGYVLRYEPNHPYAIKSGGEKGYVYEHRLVVVRERGYLLRKDEEVHHLDLDRSNNSPENLITLTTGQHKKIHQWLENGAPIHGHNTNIISHSLIRQKRKKIPRCEVCKFPLNINQNKFCSLECYRISQPKTNIPNKKELKSLLREQTWVDIGKLYGVSDNAVRKWAIKMGINPKDYKRGKYVGK